MTESHCVGTGELNLGPLREQVLVITRLTLKDLFLFIYLCVWLHVWFCTYYCHLKRLEGVLITDAVVYPVSLGIKWGLTPA